MSRATVDQNVRFFLGYGLIFLVQHVLTVVGVTVILLVIDWRLPLIALAITPLLIAVAWRYSHVSHPVLRDVQQRIADMTTVAEESIVGVNVVKAFGQEDPQEAKFRDRAERVFSQSVRATRQQAQTRRRSASCRSRRPPCCWQADTSWTPERCRSVPSSRSTCTC